METKTILLILSFLASISPGTIDLETFNLNGKVWKVKEISYEGEDNMGEYQLGDKDYSGHSLFVFNEKGILTEEETLNQEGQAVGFLKYILDENNNLAKKQTLDENEETTQYFDHHYDSLGNCIEVDIYQGDILVSKIVNEIDNNQIIQTKMLDDKGRLMRNILFKYSGSNITETRILDHEEKLAYKIENEWLNGFLTKETATDNSGQIIYASTYQRNKNNDVIKSITEYPVDSGKIVSTYAYHYDINENWVKKYQFDKEGKIGKIVVRDITYYE